MANAPRDERPLHDQIIQHELRGLEGDQVLRLIVVELRKLREAICSLDGYPKKSPGGD